MIISNENVILQFSFFKKVEKLFKFSLFPVPIPDTVGWWTGSDAAGVGWLSEEGGESVGGEKASHLPLLTTTSQTVRQSAKYSHTETPSEISHSPLLSSHSPGGLREERGEGSGGILG